MTCEEYKKAVADRIAARLEALGLQRQQFAYMMKVSPSTVTSWLKGGHNFTTKTLFEIERVLNFSIFDFTKTSRPIPEEFQDRYLGWV